MRRGRAVLRRAVTSFLSEEARVYEAVLIEHEKEERGRTRCLTDRMSIQFPGILAELR
jgi:hypothetical protein